MIAKDIQRIFFLVEDESTCDEVEASLLELGVEEERIFIYDQLQEDLIALPEQGLWDKDRRVPMVVWGVILGAITGFLSAYLRSFADPLITVDLFALVTIAGSVLGAILFHFATGNEHHKRLQAFQDSIYQRGLLLVCDVSRIGYRKIHQQIIVRHPAKYLGSIHRAKL